MNTDSHNSTTASGQAGRERRRRATPLVTGASLAAFLIVACLILAGLGSGAGATGPAGTIRAAGVAATVGSAGTAGMAATPAPDPAPPIVATSNTASATGPEVPALAPTFTSSVEAIDAALEARMITSGSWKSTDPVSLVDLRLVHVTYWGFDGRPHTGSLVVDRTWATKLCGVFRTLYEARFPIRSMDLIDVFGADDDRSMAADNTSAYNGRHVQGTASWSMHAYGSAIDINPVENPYVRGRSLSPAAGAIYADRSLGNPGMIRPGGVVVQAFASIGWKWGGDWRSAKDYQHFSNNGR